MEWSWANGKKMMGDFDALPNGKSGVSKLGPYGELALS